MGNALKKCKVLLKDALNQFCFHHFSKRETLFKSSLDGSHTVSYFLRHQLYFYITAMGGPYSDLGLPTTKHENPSGLRGLSYKKHHGY